jgi:hypothetical protein
VGFRVVAVPAVPEPGGILLAAAGLAWAAVLRAGPHRSRDCGFLKAKPTLPQVRIAHAIAAS